MENPFQRRATELLRDDEAFLAVVSPEPVTHFLGKPGQNDRLYDRLVLIRGTPGSGKTTLARLFEFPTICTLLRNQSFAGQKEIHAALTTCRAIENEQPRVLGCRLPLETDYRDFWEFGYKEDLKSNLMTALLQARAVLGWFRHLRAVGVPAKNVRLVTRPEALGLLETIGGREGESVRDRAARLENAIYGVMTALVAPPEFQLPAEAIAPYRPFDIIDHIQIPGDTFGQTATLNLVPLAIFDDAHVLHPAQFQALKRFLVRREPRVARWMIARFDVLLPDEALAAAISDSSDSPEYPGVTADRETTDILLQSSGNRRAERTRFRSMAKDMANRYLRRMPLLYERGHTNFGNLLGDRDVTITPGRLKELREKVDGAQKKLRISAVIRKSFEEQILASWKKTTPLGEDLAQRMLWVMMHRYDVRRKRSKTPTLFDEQEATEPEIEVAANAEVLEAALFQLLHDADRPYYFGIDDVCDASSENAEQFLQLAAALVETIAAQLARAKPPSLLPVAQQKLLRERAAEVIKAWNFPHDAMVRRLVSEIAKRCLAKSLEPNGVIIANAFGILQAELDRLPTSHPEFARVLQFAVAYNAITLVPHYSCQKDEWCLLELGGMVLLSNGLTLKRGGFIKSSADEVAGFTGEPKP